MMNMHIPYDEESLIQLTLDLVRGEGWQTDIYIRPLIYKADLGIGVRLHDLKDELTIFSMPFKQYVKNDTDAHVTVSSWRRLDDNMIPARGKVSGAYANSALIKTDAATRRLRRGAGAQPGRPHLRGQRHEPFHGA
jgi:branched-chain amino acid aminotransferase